MDIKELTRRVYDGEDLLDEVLLKMFRPKEAERIKKAASEDAPIIFIDESGKGGDMLLYRALKNFGVSVVKGYDQMKAFKPMKKNAAYFAIFLNEQIDTGYIAFNPNLFETP